MGLAKIGQIISHSELLNSFCVLQANDNNVKLALELFEACPVQMSPTCCGSVLAENVCAIDL